MSRPLPLTLVSLALLGAGIHLAWPRAVPAADPGTVVGALLPAAPQLGESAPLPAFAAATAAMPRSGPFAPVPTADRPAAGSDRGEPATVDDRLVGPHGHVAAPKPYAAKRLGWAVDDPRLDFVSGWLGDRRLAERELVDRVAHSGGAAQVAAMQRYNRAVDAWRVQLVQQLGVDAASQVVDRFCLYHFDPAEGSWHRVDATGRRVAFQHEDDDIWQRGECSDPRWEGHW